MEATQNVVHIDKFQAPNLVGIIAQALEQHIESIVSTKVHAMIDEAIKKHSNISEQIENWMKYNFDISDYFNFSDSFSDEINTWMTNNFDISDYFDIRDYGDEIGEIAAENIDGDTILEALSSKGCSATISF